jgi:hypothetical protein
MDDISLHAMAWILEMAKAVYGVRFHKSIIPYSSS